MTNNLRVILCTLLLAFATVAGFAQDRKALEQQRKKLESDIEFNKNQLEKIDQDKQKSMDQIEILSSQIETREKMISNLGRDLTMLNSNIRELESVVASLEKDLTDLKKRYAEMLYYAYRNRSSRNDIVFLLSADSFNDAINRLKYLQQYSQFRKHQADLIEQTKADLAKHLAQLQDKRNDQQQLIDKEENHRKHLDQEKDQKDELVTQLQKKERQLAKDIKKKQEKMDALNKQIEDIIKKEIAAAKEKERLERERLERERAEKEKNNAKPGVKTEPVKAAPSPDLKLSSRFAENKGKLPWPVANGVISSSFGPHPHPVVKGVMINNKGIDIRIDDNEKVRAVFDGEVIAITSAPGFDQVVIVKHGEYFTVYYKLKSVTVKTGENVTTKQEIGSASGEMHFEVWQGEVRLNPALWIYGQ